MTDYEPMSDAEWLRKELFAARAERDAALQDAEDLNIEVEHYAKLAIVDLGANPTVSWMERAEAAEAERDALRELLREAAEKLQPISALVDMTPSGFPDHDICPIRLGMARDLRELRARIDAALSKGGEDE